jgi:hypothetical protein
LRLKGKEIAEITKQELDSNEFKAREKEFLVFTSYEDAAPTEFTLAQAVIQQEETPKSRKRKTKTQSETEPEITNDETKEVPLDSEPDLVDGSL